MKISGMVGEAFFVDIGGRSVGRADLAGALMGAGLRVIKVQEAARLGVFWVVAEGNAEGASGRGGDGESLRPCGKGESKGATKAEIDREWVREVLQAALRGPYGDAGENPIEIREQLDGPITAAGQSG